MAVAIEFWASIKLVRCKKKGDNDLFYSVFTFKGTLKVYNKRNQEQVSSIHTQLKSASHWYNGLAFTCLFTFSKSWILMVYFGWLTLGNFEMWHFSFILALCVPFFFILFYLWKLQNAVKIAKRSMLIRLLNLGATFYLCSYEL